MAPGRPPVNDPPHKYSDAWEMYLLSQDGGDRHASTAERVAAFLEWAISDGQPGFDVGDIIAVGALAEGVGRSRNTAAKAIERLARRGMVVQERAKSPYRIASALPVFADAGAVADEQISLTLKMASASLVSPVRPMDLACADDPLAVLLRSELAGSGDNLVRQASRGWARGEVQVFQRLRTLDGSAGRQACLAEITWVRLDGLAGAGLRSRVTRLREQHVTRVSLYALLEQSGLHDVRAGRSQVTVGVPPVLPEPGWDACIGADAVDHAAFSGGEPLVKWTYGLFRPDPEPMVSFSVCWVRTDLLGVFIRSLDVEQLHG
jgi:biotin operon repressor